MLSTIHLSRNKTPQSFGIAKYDFINSAAVRDAFEFHLVNSVQNVISIVSENDS